MSTCDIPNTHTRLVYVQWVVFPQYGDRLLFQPLLFQFSFSESYRRPPSACLDEITSEVLYKFDNLIFN